MFCFLRYRERFHKRYRYDLVNQNQLLKHRLYTRIKIEKNNKTTRYKWQNNTNQEMRFLSKRGGLYFGAWHVHQSPFYTSYVRIVLRYKW